MPQEPIKRILVLECNIKINRSVQLVLECNNKINRSIRTYWLGFACQEYTNILNTGAYLEVEVKLTEEVDFQHIFQEQQ